MGAAAYNRGSRAIRAQLDRERMPEGRYCGGVYDNGPGKRYARCRRCRAIDYEANEGDRCGRLLVFYL